MTNKLNKTDQQQVLDVLADHGPMSRRELSFATGIPSPDHSSPLKRLMNWGSVIIDGSCQPARRKAHRYALGIELYPSPTRRYGLWWMPSGIGMGKSFLLKLS